jgi:sulfopyruvate decarboxylase subunit beta
MMKRDRCFEILARHVTEDDIVVGIYSSAFDWITIRQSPLNYIFTGAMGLGSSHALGLALGRPDRRVIVLDGDGSLLMNLGSLVTVATVAPPNLYHFVSVNGTYEANGGHPTPGKGVVDFKGFAASAGYPNCFAFSDLHQFENEIPSVLGLTGPVFAALAVEQGKPPVLDYKLMHGAKTREAFQAALNAK